MDTSLLVATITLELSWAQVTGIQCDQLGVVLFKTDSLHCHVFLNPQHHQSLHLKLTQLPPGMTDQQKPLPPPFQWNPEDLHTIERFFDSRVVMPPYRQSALWAFGRLLTVPPPVLRDFIQIMRLELMPEMLPGLKWHVQFCMRSPPSALPVVPAAVVMIRQKILFFVSILPSKCFYGELMDLLCWFSFKSPVSRICLAWSGKTAFHWSCRWSSTSAPI